MKLKFGLVFLVMALGFLFAIFKGGYFTRTVEPAQLEKKAMSSNDILTAIASMTDLRDYNGDKLQISSKELLSNNKTIIHLWASWCGPCVNEVPELIEFSKKNSDVKFIIVSMDEYTEDIAKFLKSFPDFSSKSYVQIWDAEKKLSNLLDADRLPMSVIIDSNQPEPRLIKSVVDWKNLKL